MICNLSATRKSRPESGGEAREIHPSPFTIHHFSVLKNGKW
jgi:hypothetical protein